MFTNHPLLNSTHINPYDAASQLYSHRSMSNAPSTIGVQNNHISTRYQHNYSYSITDDDLILFAPAYTYTQSVSQLSKSKSKFPVAIGVDEFSELDGSLPLNTELMIKNLDDDFEDDEEQYDETVKIITTDQEEIQDKNTDALKDRINEWQINQSRHLIHELMRIENRNAKYSISTTGSNKNYKNRCISAADATNILSDEWDEDDPATYWGITDNVDWEMLSDDSSYDFSIISRNMRFQEEMIKNGYKENDHNYNHNNDIIKKRRFFGNYLLQKYNSYQIRLIKTASKELGMALQLDIKGDKIKLNKRSHKSTSSLVPNLNEHENNTYSKTINDDSKHKPSRARTLAHSVINSTISLPSTLNANISPMVWGFTSALQRQQQQAEEELSISDKPSNSQSNSYQYSKEVLRIVQNDNFWDDSSLCSSLSAEVNPKTLISKYKL